MMDSGFRAIRFTALLTLFAWSPGCSDEGASRTADAGVETQSQRHIGDAPAPGSGVPKFCALYRGAGASRLRAKGFGHFPAATSGTRSVDNLAPTTSGSRHAPTGKPGPRVVPPGADGNSSSFGSVQGRSPARTGSAPKAPEKPRELWVCREGDPVSAEIRNTDDLKPWRIPAMPAAWVWWYAAATQNRLWSLQVLDKEGKSRPAQLDTALFEDHIRLELSLLNPMQANSSSDFVLRATSISESAEGVQDSPKYTSSIRVRIAPGMAPPR